MTDTKHSADLPPLPEPNYRKLSKGTLFENCWTADQMREYARAAIAAAAPAGEPVAWGAWRISLGRWHTTSENFEYMNRVYGPGSENGGRDFEIVPFYRGAPVPAAAPKAALTTEQIIAIIQKFDADASHGLDYSALIGDEIITFARAIELASGPNAALVEALQLLLNCDKNNSFGSRVHAVNKATAALAAAGVKP